MLTCAFKARRSPILQPRKWWSEWHHSMCHCSRWLSNIQFPSNSIWDLMASLAHICPIRWRCLRAYSDRRAGFSELRHRSRFLHVQRNLWDNHGLAGRRTRASKHSAEERGTSLLMNGTSTNATDGGSYRLSADLIAGSPLNFSCISLNSNHILYSLYTVYLQPLRCLSKSEFVSPVHR